MATGDEKYYVLIKMSTPGWQLTTRHESHILHQLEGEICQSCRITEEECSDEDTEYECIFFPSDYETMTIDDKISALLSTSCGCEFELESYDSYDEYIKTAYKWLIEYEKTKSGSTP